MAKLVIILVASVSTYTLSRSSVLPEPAAAVVLRRPQSDGRRKRGGDGRDPGWGGQREALRCRHAQSPGLARGARPGPPFDGWPRAGSEDAGKKKLGEALRRTDAAYAGGLPAYVTKARALLEASQRGDNPFDGFSVLHLMGRRHIRRPEDGGHGGEARVRLGRRASCSWRAAWASAWLRRH